MARKNERIIVEVDGDTTGLQKKLNQAEDSIGKFGKKAGGSIGGAADSIASGLGRISGGFVGIVGAVGVAGTALAGLAIKLNDNVRQLNQLSMQSGLTVTELQKLDKAFYRTGVNAEKLADINQDTLDKLGDAFANGGAISDDIKSVGLDINDFTKYLNQADGGIKAVIDTFYKLKDAGRTTGEITFLLESMGSDASRLVSVLNESANSQEAWNKINNESVIISEDTAAAFQKFDDNLQSATRTGQSYLYDFMTPVIKEFNDLYELVNKDWTGSDFMQMLYRGADNFVLGGKGAIPDFLKKLLGKDSLDSAFIAGSNEYDFVNASRAGYEANKGKWKTNPRNTGTADPKSGWGAKQEAEKAAAAAKKAQEAAARKAEAAAKQAAAKRIQAERALGVALSQVAENAGEQRLQVFDRQQNELLKTIETTAKTVGKTASEIEALLDRARKSGARARTELIDSMIGYTDPNQDLKDQVNISGMGINKTQSNFLSDQQAQRLNGDNPFAYDNTQKLLEENKKREELELQLNANLLQSTEDFEKRKADIQARYAAQAMQIAQQNTNAQMNILATAAGDMGNVLAGVFGEGNKAAAAAFAIQKGINMAQIMMNMQVALSEALATPFPANIAAYGQILGMGAQLISTARGTNISGQFHGGVDSLDPSMDNKSFVLKAGERVVQPEANKKLTEFLDNNSGSNNYGGDTTIYAPLIVQGSIGDDDAKFNEMLKKHSQSVNQAVRDAQKRST
ncbi:hypothetical protein V6L59_002684 [Salmonella enterica]